MSKENENLFSGEEIILKNASFVLEDSKFVGNPLLAEYQTLLENYRKLLNQDKKLVKISDGLQNKIKKAKNEIENLNEISRQISMSLDFDIVFASIFEYLKNTYGFEGCCLTLVSHDKENCKNEKFIATSIFESLVDSYTGAIYSLKLNKGPIVKCISNKDIGVYSNKNIFEESENNHSIKTAFLMPITIGGEVMGAFSLIHHSDIIIKSDEKESLRKFANHISVVIKNSKLYEDSEKARIKQLEEFNLNLMMINKSLQKFVPKDFIQFLNKEHITDVGLGDSVQQEMSILFSDIRSFTAISETMSPKDNFGFLNSYLKVTSPVIRKNKGFIDKYIGDAIMALFPESASDAIDAGIQMLDEVHKLNVNRNEWGRVPIQIGIGIHTGAPMLGVIGEEKRFEFTVISDAVNLASRIEGLTKAYSASILISEDTLNALKNPEKYFYRMVDKVTVKGKKKPVTIYEILNGNSKRIIDLKLSTKKDFEEGINIYLEEKFEESCEIFKKILKIDPKDTAVSLYLERAKFYTVHGVPINWEGAWKLDTK
ncbi:MAG: GAF domain-containing protein [Leptospiraceae bacterium]|nr:GAF domain-containing protein [Leptospiraceae bacterium]